MASINCAYGGRFADLLTEGRQKNGETSVYLNTPLFLFLFIALAFMDGHYLAEQMIRLSGKVPGEDIEISYTGLRPGEKLFEELFHPKEALQSTSHRKILLVRHRDFGWERLTEIMEQLRAACASFDEVTLQSLMAELVPEWNDSAPKTDNRSATVPIEEGRASAEEQNPTLH